MGCCSSKLNFYSGEIFALLNKCDENSECIGLAQLIKVGEKKFGFSKTKKTRPNSKHLKPMYTNMQSKNKYLCWKLNHCFFLAFLFGNVTNDKFDNIELNSCHSVHLLSL